MTHHCIPCCNEAMHVHLLPLPPSSSLPGLAPGLADLSSHSFFLSSLPTGTLCFKYRAKQDLQQWVSNSDSLHHHLFSIQSINPMNTTYYHFKLESLSGLQLGYSRCLLHTIFSLNIFIITMLSYSIA